MNESDYNKLNALIQAIEEIGYLFDKEKFNDFKSYLYEKEELFRVQKEKFLQNLKKDIEEAQEFISPAFYEEIIVLINSELQPLLQIQAMKRGEVLSASNSAHERNSIRQLPVFFIIDNSKHTNNEGLIAIQGALQAILLTFMDDFFCYKHSCISLISTCVLNQSVIPLTDLPNFEIPQITGTNNASCFGNSLKTLKREIKTYSADANSIGDWLPLIFLLSQGNFDDEWEEEFNEIYSKKNCIKNGRFIIVACGRIVNDKQLKTMSQQLSEDLLYSAELDTTTVQAFYKHIFVSI